MNATARTAGAGRRTLAALAALVVLSPLVATAASAETETETTGSDAAPEVVVDPTDGFEPDISTRIVGGVTAPPGAWPSQVGLLRAGVASNYQAQFCGGTVIHRWWVVTAAHCMYDPNTGVRLAATSVDVLVGTQSLASGGERIRAREIRIVGGYTPAPPTRDLAMIRLSKPTTVPVQQLIGAGAAVPVGAELVATGWGTTAHGTNSFPPELRQVTVEALADAACGNYGGFYKPASMLCAGVPGGGKDACQGDSGGPLVRRVGDRWVQVGVTSWGHECARAGFPGLYTKLASFRSWTDQQLRFGPHRSATAFVDQTYRDLFDRLPSATERWYGVAALNDGATPQAWVRDLVQGPTYQGRMAGITRLYRAYFLREPDQSGLHHWWQRINGGWSGDRISQYFAGSAEFVDRYGRLDNRQFVELVYRNVFPDRPADAAGVDFWTAELDAGRRNRGRVMSGFAQSAEYRTTHKASVDVTITFFALVRRVPTAGELATWSGRTNEALVAFLLDSQGYHGRTF